LPPLDFAGMAGIVTGASRGIGYATAQVLASRGMQLVLVARSKDLLEDLAASLPTDCLAIACDLRDPSAATDVVDAAVARFGRLDALVNIAGATKRGDFLELTDADWADGFALKFSGAMRLCRASWGALATAKGTIVNIAGMAARAGNGEFTIGGAVNAAVLNLTKSLADRGQQDGVRVHAVNPGSIATERLRTRVQAVAKAQDLDEPLAATAMARALGVPRFGRPEEVAEVIAFLLSAQASYMQGTIIDVDGGQSRAL
jgi:NAD(P)-dependent dehydrogenase (short-subunit alcohol dehydrogenase family)